MLKHIAIAATAAWLAAAPASAFDISDMTAAERQAFRDEVRSYLLENPELLVEVISILEQRQAEAQAQGDSGLIATHAAAIFDDGFSYVGGNADGDITVVEFLDYRCGYCRKSHPEVAELLSGDGNIRFIVKEFPILGEESTMASRFAISTKMNAGDEAYLAVHDALMTDTGRITEGRLRRLAQSLDLDADDIVDGMQHPEIDKMLQTNYALAQALRITGTPGFVIGETMLRGYAPLDVMQAMVAEERKNQ